MWAKLDHEEMNFLFLFLREMIIETFKPHFHFHKGISFGVDAGQQNLFIYQGQII